MNEGSTTIRLMQVEDFNAVVGIDAKVGGELKSTLRLFLFALEIWYA